MWGNWHDEDEDEAGETPRGGFRLPPLSTCLPVRAWTCMNVERAQPSARVISNDLLYHVDWAVVVRAVGQAQAFEL